MDNDVMRDGGFRIESLVIDGRRTLSWEADKKGLRYGSSIEFDDTEDNIRQGVKLIVNQMLRTIAEV